MDWSKFKQCPSCRFWFSAKDIIEGPFVDPIGMSFDDANPRLNVFFFNHNCENCHTTFTVEAERFEPFIMEPVPKDALTGTDECEGHCQRLDDLSVCGAECRYAPFRRFLLSMVEAKARKAKEPAR